MTTLRDSRDVEPRDLEFDRLCTYTQRVRFLLDYAVLAPSTHNTQPWRFELKPYGILVPALRERLRMLLGLSDWPQLALRLGYARALQHGVQRRPVWDVIVH
jgi:nitroreductase